MNPEIVSFQYATCMCLLLEDMGGSEQNRSVIANVQSDDLWPSRMHAAILSTGQWRRRCRGWACFSRTAHRAHETVQLLQQETPQFISPELWPPNSPDLNPVDYRIWGWMQEHVYKTPVRDTDNLKRRLIDTWASIQQSVGDSILSQQHLCQKLPKSVDVGWIYSV